MGNPAVSGRETGLSASGVNGFLFDLDGCLYRGNSALPGAVALLEYLRREGKRIAFVSNNSTQEAREISDRLNRLGIRAEPDEVIVPMGYVGSFILERYGPSSVYSLAGSPVLRSLEASGHSIAKDGDARCDVVLVARDVEFSYGKLESASRFLAAGAFLVATNADTSHPGEAGYPVPETGALLAALLAVSNKTCAIIGKPETFLFGKALESLCLSPAEALMVGDNLHTDIVGAKQAGMRTVWINTEGAVPPPGIEPWKECSGLCELLEYLRNSAIKE